MFISSKNKRTIDLVTSVICGLGLLIGGLFIIYSSIGNPYEEYLLLTQGVKTKAHLTGSTEDVETDESGRVNRMYYYGYNFRLPNGNLIESGGRSSIGLPDESEDSNESAWIEVVYLSKDPTINRSKDSIAGSVSDFFWHRIGGSALFFSLFLLMGIKLIVVGIKRYKDVT